MTAGLSWQELKPKDGLRVLMFPALFDFFLYYYRYAFASPVRARFWE